MQAETRKVLKTPPTGRGRMGEGGGRGPQPVRGRPEPEDSWKGHPKPGSKGDMLKAKAQELKSGQQRLGPESAEGKRPAKGVAAKNEKVGRKKSEGPSAAGCDEGRLVLREKGDRTRERQLEKDTRPKKKAGFSPRHAGGDRRSKKQGRKQQSWVKKGGGSPKFTNLFQKRKLGRHGKNYHNGKNCQMAHGRTLRAGGRFGGGQKGPGRPAKSAKN